jgi:5-formyltetrahydrofolate cyclo-ligase
MATDLNLQKTALRKQIRGVLQKIPPAVRTTMSAQIRDRLKESAIWKNAGAVLFFAPLPDEPDVWRLLEDALAGGKIAALPRFDSTGNCYVACQVKNPRSELVPGQFGIREPGAGCVEIPFNRLDLALVPGVAFDLQGQRLGRGRGFYDRLLADVDGIKCGIALDEQVVEEIPAGPSDIRLNFILTPTRCVEIAD